MVAIILLAAGASLRMGQSKQLLKIGNNSLLEHSTRVAVQSGIKTFVVLGANESEHRKEIEHLKAEIIFNENWRKGMGRSLKVGLKYVLDHFPEMEAIIVMVCDQPYVTASYLNKIENAYLISHSVVVASQYFETSGVPALFDSSLFPELLALSDDHGAKRVIQQHLTETFLLNFPEGSIDLDTPDDYKSFSE